MNYSAHAQPVVEHTVEWALHTVDAQAITEEIIYQNLRAVQKETEDAWDPE